MKKLFCFQLVYNVYTYLYLQLNKILYGQSIIYPFINYGEKIKDDSHIINQYLCHAFQLIFTKNIHDTVSTQSFSFSFHVLLNMIHLSDLLDPKPNVCKQVIQCSVTPNFMFI